MTPAGSIPTLPLSASLEVRIVLDAQQVEAIARSVLELIGEPEQPTAETTDLISVAQAAELAGVAPKTITNWLSSGRLTRHGAPRRPLVSRDEVLTLLAPASPPEGRSARQTRPAKRRPSAGAFSRAAREV
jgi:hypothetical protein